MRRAQEAEENERRRRSQLVIGPGFMGTQGEYEDQQARAHFETLDSIRNSPIAGGAAIFSDDPNKIRFGDALWNLVPGGPGRSRFQRGGYRKLRQQRLRERQAQEYLNRNVAPHVGSPSPGSGYRGENLPVLSRTAPAPPARQFTTKQELVDSQRRALQDLASKAAEGVEKKDNRCVPLVLRALLEERGQSLGIEDVDRLLDMQSAPHSGIETQRLIDALARNQISYSHYEFTGDAPAHSAVEQLIKEAENRGGHASALLLSHIEVTRNGDVATGKGHAQLITVLDGNVWVVDIENGGYYGAAIRTADNFLSRNYGFQVTPNPDGMPTLTEQTYELILLN